MDWLEIFKLSGDNPIKLIALGGLFHGIRELSKMRKSVEIMQSSVEKLNVSMALNSYKVQTHEKRIDHLEKVK
jgi:hypothetical protein